MISEVLLNQIANPKLIDPGEQYRAGQQEGMRLRKQQKAVKKNDRNTAIKQAFENVMIASTTDNVEEQNTALIGALKNAEESGVPEASAVLKGILNTQDPGKRKIAIAKLTETGYMGGWLTQPKAVAAKETKPYTDMGKLNTDYANGLLTKDEFIKHKDILEAKGEEKPYSSMAQLNTDLKNKKITPEQYEIEATKIKAVGEAKPYTDIGKLNSDFANKLITDDQYISSLENLENPPAKNKIELIKRSLAGDVEAMATLKEMARLEVQGAGDKSEATTKGKLTALEKAMDIDGIANDVISGKESFNNIKNTFGVPIRMLVRKRIEQLKPDFNFVIPQAVAKGLEASAAQQLKNRGAMGSFVTNINGQVTRVEEMSEDIIKRVGIRALDVPIRKFNTTFIGSGHERAFEAYMKEISAEIAKLAQGSAASISQLPEANREDWERIHDPNLSLRELLIVLNATREMANIRLHSVEKEIVDTFGKMQDITKVPPVKPLGKQQPLVKPQTATNPTTGETMVLVNGKWEKQ